MLYDKINEKSKRKVCYPIDYAGKDERMARQVAAWTNVIDIACEPESCIALFADGSVAMAGHHHEGYFR